MEVNALTRWLRYYVETERYDRTIMRGRNPRTGDARPVSAFERGESTRFANMKRQELGLAPPNDGYPEVRQYVSGMTTIQQEIMLDDLEQKPKDRKPW